MYIAAKGDESEQHVGRQHDCEEAGVRHCVQRCVYTTAGKKQVLQFTSKCLFLMGNSVFTFSLSPSDL